MDGGAGTDTLSFMESAAVGTSGRAYTTPSSIEKLIGSPKADFLEAGATGDGTWTAAPGMTR